MKKSILFSVICTVACWSNSFAQYPNWINYTSGQGIYALADNGGGLANFNGSNWTVYNTSNSGLPDDQVLALAIDGSDNIWIGTMFGLAKFDGSDWSMYRTWNSGLPDNLVFALAIDASNIWIGTWLGGLAVYPASLAQYKLTISAGTGGTTNPSPGDHSYDAETQVDITAAPDSGYEFSGWSGDASGTTNPITITMDSDKSITATFKSTTTGDGDSEGKKGGCFIATVAYDSPLHPYVETLREFRDLYLMRNWLGCKLVDLYYKCSPFVAKIIAKRKVLKVAVRINLLPLVVLSYSMVYFGPTITAIMLVLIFALPVFVISFFRRKLRRII